MQTEPTEEEIQIEAMTTRFEEMPTTIYDIVDDVQTDMEITRIDNTALKLTLAESVNGLIKHTLEAVIPFKEFAANADELDLPWMMDDALLEANNGNPDFLLPVEMCGRCYEEFETMGNLESSRCSEKPERLLGQPIGQYHCPDCGAMVLAGIPHPTVCHRCATRTHPSFD